MSRIEALLAVALVLALAWEGRADPYLDAVVETMIGTRGGHGAELDVLGPPQGEGAFVQSRDTLSLGLGGHIIVQFVDNVVVDRPGPDFTVFENPFLQAGINTCLPFAEPATVSVSADGQVWRTFPCDLRDLDASVLRCEPNPPAFHAGCAGVYPVFAKASQSGSPSPLIPSTTPLAALVGVPKLSFTTPAGSGGDSFDLADVGLAAIRFVRIEAGDHLPDNHSPALDQLEGFDLDAIAAVHSVETAGAADTDADGIIDLADDCPLVVDAAQLDTDRDGVGDLCDNCPTSNNATQADRDADGIGDACDNCPATANANQIDTDHDGIGDVCDTAVPLDSDGDGVLDAADNCPVTANAAQTDGDGDGVGDACDRCPLLADPTNADRDHDGVGDVCDLCPALPDPAQLDSDGDGTGDACEVAPPAADRDGDGVPDALDPCPDEPACGPLLPPRFAGLPLSGDGEDLLTFREPEGALATVEATATTVRVTLVIAARTRPGSVHIRVSGRDLTRQLGPFRPGSTRTILIPLRPKHTVVRLQARGPKGRHHASTDLDILTLRRSLYPKEKQ